MPAGIINRLQFGSQHIWVSMIPTHYITFIASINRFKTVSNVYIQTPHIIVIIRQLQSSLVCTWSGSSPQQSVMTLCYDWLSVIDRWRGTVTRWPWAGRPCLERQRMKLSFLLSVILTVVLWRSVCSVIRLLLTTLSRVKLTIYR